MPGIAAKLGARIRRDLPIGFEETYVYRLESSDARARCELDVPGARIEPLSLHDLPRLAELGPTSETECVARMQRGDACYGAWLGDTLVHAAWVQRAGSHVIEPPGMTREVGAGEIWIYNCRTLETHRGRGLYPATLAWIVGDHAGAGGTAAWIYTSAQNLASQRGIARAGFVLDERLRAIRIGRDYVALRPHRAAVS